MKCIRKSKKLISKREKDVIWLLAQERNSVQIGKELYISKQTVETHRKNIMGKLDAKNTAGVIRSCFELGILKLDEKGVTVLHKDIQTWPLQFAYA